MPEQLLEVVSPISLFALKVRQVVRGKEVGSGTGFILKSQDDRETLYLVTNWHIVTGRERQAPEETMKGMPCSPDALRFDVFEKESNYDRKLTLRLNLYDEENRLPRWFEHQNGFDYADVIAFPLPPIPHSAHLVTTADLAPNQEIKIEVGMEIFVVGYPYGLTPTGLLPVWKRGTIASEPFVMIENHPMFLVDASTRPGMSGSPVFAVATGAYRTEGGEVRQDFGPHMTYKFIGIHSAHLDAGGGRPLPELGVVWHLQVLEEILGNPKPGENPFPPEFE